MTLWKNLQKQMPVDGATVWIVRIPFFDTPVQAVFNGTTEKFDWTDSNADTVSYEKVSVFKWRPV